MTQHRPGQWPVSKPADLDAIQHDQADDQAQQYVKRAAEKALHEICLDSIRHDLDQQPTGNSAKAKARIWCAHILAIADEVAAAKQRAA
ncbi:hypothetical protein ABZS88_11280 [Streptomyces sp. NPDC005480]|uniref:hypothetical protein n=1 Tax=Streptomyces sp. NPDC005480 TaxID=3154880 RepID=UPI0033A31342